MLTISKQKDSSNIPIENLIGKNLLPIVSIRIEHASLSHLIFTITFTKLTLDSVKYSSKLIDQNILIHLHNTNGFSHWKIHFSRLVCVLPSRYCQYERKMGAFNGWVSKSHFAALLRHCVNQITAFSASTRHFFIILEIHLAF